MISRLRGNLLKLEDNRLILEISGICYEVYIPITVANRLKLEEDKLVELVIFHYINIDGNRGIPIIIGFIDDMERDFFEKFISVSGVGPKAALKAFDQPVSLIARAIEDSDMDFLTSLSGIGKQKAKQIIASLQGKVGRFALLKSDSCDTIPVKKELVEEAKAILKRLQYSDKEAEDMIKRALAVKKEVDNVEDLLNEIYCQRR